jgi:ribulose-5-phosphate 4-epimerase/fuculose-1-phosphate aldolase
MPSSDIVSKISFGKGLDTDLITPPVFSDKEEERLYRKQRLAAAFRLFGHYGFDEGVAGHISVRDPILTDCFWVNPMSVHFSLIKVSDLVLVNHDGEIKEGKRAINKAAFAIHSRIHLHKPEINAVAHAHSVYGRIWSTLGRFLDPITQDACTFYENQVIYDVYKGVVADCNEGDDIAGLLGDKATVILQNHGLLSAAKSVESAAWLFILMDKCCKSQILAEAVGKPKIISHDVAVKARTYIANEVTMFANFQPLYNMILSKQADFLD